MKKHKNLFVKVLIFAMVVSSIFAFTACGDSNALTQITGIKYEDGRIVWDEKKNGNFEVLVNDVVTNVKNKNFLEIPKDIKNFVFKIKDTNVKKSEYVEVKFEKLPDLVIVKKDNTLDWSASIGSLATMQGVAYKLVVDGQETEPTTLTSIPMQEGKHTYKVRAIIVGNDRYYSSFSESVTSHVLQTPTNIGIDAYNITWSPISDASSYVVEINGKEYQTVTALYATTSKEIASGLQIRIKAKSDDKEKLESNFSDYKTYKSLRRITRSTIRINDGALLWEDIEGAVGYELEIEQGGETTKAKVDNAVYEGLAPNTSYSVRIRGIAESDLTISAWSEDITIQLYQTPTLSYELGSFKWTPVSECDGYRVKIVEEVVLGDKVTYTQLFLKDYSNDVMFFRDYEFNNAGKYLVYVCALSKNATYLDSKWSEPISVVRLAAPSKYRLDDNLIPNGKLVFDFDSVGADAERYKLLLDGSEVSARVGYKTVFDIPKPYSYMGRTYKMEVQSCSNSSSAINGKVVLDSLETLQLNIRKLPVPKNIRLVRDTTSQIELNGTSNINIAWDEIYLDTNNTVKCKYGVSLTNYSISDTNVFRMPQIGPGGHDLKVYARGDVNNGDIVGGDLSEPITYESDGEIQEKIVSSDFTSAFHINKLDKVSNIEAKDGILSWDGISNTSGYKVFLDGKPYELLDESGVSNNGIFAISQIVVKDTDAIKESGSHINIRALGKCEGITFGDIPYIDSDATGTYIIKKLVAPIGLSVNDNSLIWNSVPNATGYDVFRKGASGNYTRYSTSTATTYSLSDLSSGSYTFVVRALGDDRKLFTSNYSLEITFEKLPSIADDSVGVRKIGGNYVFKSIPNAVRYSITIDGVEGTVPNEPDENGDILYTPTFSGSATSSKVTFVTIGNGSAIIKSIEYTFFQKISVLPKPIASDGNIFDAFDIDGKIVFKTNLVNPIGHGFYFDGIASDKNYSPDGSFVYNKLTAGEVTVGIKFAGEIFYDDVYYKSSLPSATKTINYLPNVTVSSITNDMTNTISWDAVADATYMVRYEIYEGAITLYESGDFVSTEGQLQLTITNAAAYKGKKIKFYIYTKGDGQTVISSKTIVTSVFDIVENK